MAEVVKVVSENMPSWERLYTAEYGIVMDLKGFSRF